MCTRTQEKVWKYRKHSNIKCDDQSGMFKKRRGLVKRYYQLNKYRRSIRIGDNASVLRARAFLIEMLLKLIEKAKNS